MIIAAVFVERWASQTGWNPALPVAIFVLASTLLGFRLFGRANEKAMRILFLMQGQPSNPVERTMTGVRSHLLDEPVFAAT